MNELRDSMEHHREEAADKKEFFWRMLYELGGFLFGKIYWTLHARTPKLFGMEGLVHLFVLLQWSWPIWLISTVAWYFLGYDFWSTVAITAVAVWFYSRFQPFTY